MRLTIRADDSGALVLPAGVLGRVKPGATFTVEPQGDDFILRRQDDDESVDGRIAAAQIEWLQSWIASLPPSAPLPEQATHRDSMYE